MHGLPLLLEDAVIEEERNIEIAWLIDMEELDIEDGNKTAVATYEASVGSIVYQTFFGDKSVGFFEDIKQFKEVTNPIQFDDQRQDEDTEVMIVEDTTDEYVQGSQGVGGNGVILKLT